MHPTACLLPLAVSGLKDTTHCERGLPSACVTVPETGTSFMPPPQPISFVYSPNRFMPVKLRAFLDFVLPRLRARLGDLPKGAAPPGRKRR